MVLTVIPLPPSSRASVFAQPTTPGRIAFESARLSIGARTELDSMLTMRPRPLRSRCGRQRFVRRIAESRRSATALSTASSVNPAAGPGGGPPPLLTRMSTPPKASTVRWTSRSRSPGTITSPRTARAPILSASRSSSSRRRPNIATFAPSAASCSAIARPIPEEAPQTTAVRPSSPRFNRSPPPGAPRPTTRFHRNEEVRTRVKRECAETVKSATGGPVSRG